MEASPLPWPALGVLLVRDGLVSKEELESILEEQHDARYQRIGYEPVATFDLPGGQRVTGMWRPAGGKG